ncbi:MAG: 16S rRNA processing protein RimM [Clostridia bacterium]|nr:16S rRNA processing protein RimM [Clostridia bacterium]
MKQEYLVCGQIQRSHGINGAMVVRHYCDSYEVLEGLKHVYIKNGESYEEHKLQKCTPYKDAALITISGITAPEEVTKIRMTYLYAKREEIAKDEDALFIVDLIDLPVKDANTDELYGTLKEVINQGAQDIYVVKREGKPDAYIPVVDAFVKSVSLEQGILITPIEGMLD